MPKLGRKIRCTFHKEDVRCIGLTNGQKLCYVFEGDEDEEFHFCSLLPDSEIAKLMADFKKEGLIDSWENLEE